MLCPHAKLEGVRRLPCGGPVPGVTPDSPWRGRFGGRRGRDRVQATVMTLKVEMRMKHQLLCCGLEQSHDFPGAA